MRILLPLDGPAEETPSMISQQPLELKDPVTCQRVWQSSTSTNQVRISITAPNQVSILKKINKSIVKSVNLHTGG